MQQPWLFFACFPQKLTSNVHPHKVQGEEQEQDCIVNAGEPMMKLMKELPAVLALMASECLAFQPVPAAMRVRTGAVLAKPLKYQNKTEDDYVSEQSYRSELDRQIEQHKNLLGSMGSIMLEEKPYEAPVEDDYEYEYTYYQEEEEYDQEPVLAYNEDGTAYVPVNPTLELLREWTQEYVDAVDLAGGGITRLSVSVEDMMCEDYIFTSPTIGPINKPDFVQLMRFYLDSGFDISSAVPDFTTHYDGWHQDPHEPWRIWVVVRYSGTHTGTAVVPQSGIKLTPPTGYDNQPVQFMTGPEMHSFLWTADKKILWQTMGYVGDAYTGSNQGKGGLEGLMVSMGLPTLYLDSTAPLRQSMSWFSQFSDKGKEPRSKSPYSSLPQWWHERKTYDLNIHR